MNKYIDHTLLKPNATIEDYTKVIKEAREYNFASVCLPPSYVKLASDILKESDVKVCTVIGFPLGYNTTSVKVDETVMAIQDGADEIDMVVNISDVKSNQWDKIRTEIKQIRQAAKTKILKVIFETAYLNESEIISLCKICTELDVDFVKTSTGFAHEGANIKIVDLMKKSIDEKVQVKASGGVRTRDDADAMILAGATRIGTSNGIQIMKNENGNEDY
jgi:deoxyribose-phosphate aldolase